MLSYLRVRGLAVLDDVELAFTPGMNVLTGETGAGKSIIVGALSLLRGLRGRPEMLREGADAAVVDAQFEPAAAGQAMLAELLADLGIEDTDTETLVVKRTLPRAGRSRSFVQGGLTTQGVLGRVGEELIDICSQHEHHFLTHPARHLDVLDAYAGLADALGEYAAAYETWQQAAASLRHLRERTRDAAQRADYLRFQIDEIDRVAPEAGEYDGLRKRLTLLRQAHRWAGFAREAHAALYDNDDAITARLAVLSDRARGGAADSSILAQMQEQLAAAAVACEEAATMAARFADDLEIEPGELEIAEDRLHALESLRRKHGVDVDDLAERVEAMREELEELDHAEEHVMALQARTQELEDACTKRARALHEARAAAAQGLATGIVDELAALHIKGARVEVRMQDAGSLGPRGGDEVEFLFSANPGEPVAPLRRVASGGELSRVLLAIKSVLCSEDRVATYVFDEVDAGVGGAVAEAIGRRLKRAATSHQVLCITHLPQIAAFADAHFRVEKRTHKGRTKARVVRLDDEERVEELARMLGGKATTARDHARQLLGLGTKARSRARV